MTRVYYRGPIDFCNYSCSYCPFAKKKYSKEKLRSEKRSLDRLHRQLQTMEQVELMFTPYGEALCHSICQEALIRFARMDSVKGIGIQTNLSLDIEKLLFLGEQTNGKLKLWATYHPEFAASDEFAAKANRLSEQIDLSVGMVADGKNLDQIRSMRSRLSPSIYLWINAMDRRKYRFDREMIERHRSIDPMFGFEFYHGRSDAKNGFEHCNSSEALYIDGIRYSSDCFFKKAKAIGRDCHDHRCCDCYLGYSNFFHSKPAAFFGSGLMFRVPQKRRYEAAFIDVDGVLLDERGHRTAGVEEALILLQSKAKLYLATARSYRSAKKALGSLMRYFSGGVFSDGALVRDFDRKWEKRSILNEIQLRKVLASISVDGDGSQRTRKAPSIPEDEISDPNRYKQEDPSDGPLADRERRSQKILWEDRIEGELLRVRVPIPIAKKIQTLHDALGEEGRAEVDPDTRPVRDPILDLNIRRYGRKCYIRSRGSSKKNGIRLLMENYHLKPDEVLFISDDLQDEEVFSYLPYTVSPLAIEEVAHLSHYQLDLKHLGFIIR
ncbi:MAG: STM4011 family radical SAM protein [Peptostreptococcaceae bacterium]|nr:STM4011 family radical SAM protein [Peptostreptococcaceae bacterium]